ncbi:MAG: LamG domain-containing protein [Actinomyces sp.]|uniref:LamG domain-containing protein n=1 Tax=Actinomyces sp. TaxID=29317 RepID=UPI0026DB6577|nr:LamG domain-containing protein [Actinomyces sp.]MDO4243474.1 LamG domain-containing protein [Actinomyces sp.]
MSADALPTVQINGVVWDQEVVGNTVYVAGSFTQARPAGSPKGSNETPRANLLAYDITTGEMLDWAPTSNGAVNTITASADGSILYLGGEFTQLNGETTWRVGSVSADTGTRIPVGASANATVRALELGADGTTLYIGGTFTQINSSARQRVAAIDLTTQRLTSFTAPVDNYFVRTIAAAVDGSAVAIGGAFTSVGSQSNPGYGMAILEPDGQLRPNNLTSVVRNATSYASIMSLEADAQGLYGAGYSMSRIDGTIEGIFRANWQTGDLDYLADCHGDSFDVHPTADVVYVSSHTHDCSNIGGLPDSKQYYNAVAYTNAATGTVGTNTASGYTNHAGQPATTNLNFYPVFTNGTYTGSDQATWTVEGNSEYVVYGGEFLSVNGTAQQGLVRFARRDIAPNAQGPMDKGGAYEVTAQSPSPGLVSLSFKANWDRDDRTLTYKVYRDDDATTPISTQTVSAGFWALPQLSATDTVEPGTTHRYRVVVEDPWGASTRSDWVTVTAADRDGSDELGPYGLRIIQDGATSYWPLDEKSGVAGADLVGGANLTLNGEAYSRGQEGAVGSGKAVAFSPSRRSVSFGTTTSARTAPGVFSIEAWFNTTSSSGGVIANFGSSTTGSSMSKDRMVYMRNDGTLGFMLYPGEVTTIASPRSYNDGNWHHVVATMSPTEGSALYVDGELVGADATMTRGQSFDGFWRVGGDSVAGVAVAPSSGFFTGSIDEVAVYGTALGADAVRAHYALGTGQDPADPQAPEADEQDQSTLLADDFSRTTSRGWGSADTGGSWTVGWGNTRFSTADSQGRIAMTGAKSSASISSQVLASTSTEAVIDMSFDAVPTGNGAYMSYQARKTSAGTYQAGIRLTSNGTVTLTVSKVVDGKETVLGTARLEGTYEAGDPLHLRIVVDGEEATTLRARAWTGDAEPEAWQIDTVDSEGTLNGPGSVGFTTYMSASAGQDETVNVAIDSVTVKRLG